VSACAYGHRGNRLLSALPADAQAALKRDMHDAMVAQATVLLEPNDIMAHVYFPQSGIISRAVIAAAARSRPPWSDVKAPSACIAPLAAR
jgi:hypothetical protein